MKQYIVVGLLTIVAFGAIGLIPGADAATTFYSINSDPANCAAIPGDTIQVLNTCTILSGITNLDPNTQLTISSGYTLEIAPGAKLNTEDLIINYGIIQVDGSFDVDISGFVDQKNTGILNISNGANARTVGGSINGDGDVFNDGTLEAINGYMTFDDVTNTGTINNYFSFTTNGLLTNSNTINVYGDMHTNNTDNTAPNGFIYVGGAFDVAGTLDNDGNIEVDAAGLFTIDPVGVVNNNNYFLTYPDESVIQIDGHFNNFDTFENYGFVQLEDHGVLNNAGTFTNFDPGTGNEIDGLISITPKVVNGNVYSIINTGTFTNELTIENYCGLLDFSASALVGPAPEDKCAPLLTITAPENNDQIQPDTDFTLIVDATDQDNYGVETDVSSLVDWTATKKGNGSPIPLGTGSPITDASISVIGVYDIDASFTDSSGNSGIDSIMVHIKNIDDDNDGSFLPDDCDDNNNTVYPGAPELVDAIDNDCNGVLSPLETDDDTDGIIDGIFDVTLAEFQSVNPLVTGDMDCDDTNNTIFPGATEIPYDGIDQDCDFVDFVDVDMDSFSSDMAVGGTPDCDDTNNTIFPGATEIPYDGIDQDCDFVDFVDVDGDGYDSDTVGGTDCDDSDAAVNPAATEIEFDGIDNDCNPATSDGTVDADGDLYTTDGSDLGNGVEIDCNDSDATVNPGATEIPYDGIDNDCSGADLVDVDMDSFSSDMAVGGTPDCDDTNNTIFPGAIDVAYDGIDQDCSGADFADVDGDGYDSDTVGGLDCDDSDIAVNPGVAEVLFDGIDNDCNPLTEDGNPDVDGDGVHSIGAGGDDCDDTQASIFPGNPEIVDGLDNDCDGVIPDNEKDFDTDGYITGTFGVTLAEFQAVNPLVLGDMDCADDSTISNNKFIYPGAVELDDGLDNDCDGIIDNDLDADGDGFTVLNGADCLDVPETDPNSPFFGADPATVYPGAVDIPEDGIDQDCDSEPDNSPLKFVLPHLQANLDDKTVRDFEKRADKLLHENNKLEKENLFLDKAADRFDAKADKAEDEGNLEEAEKFRAKADKIREEIASNESLIEINKDQILVIDMSVDNIPIDYSLTEIQSFDNLTDRAFNDILDDIEDNLDDMVDLANEAQMYDDKAEEALQGDEQKALKYEAKADKYTAKANKYQDKADQAREGNEQKALKYEARADKYTAKADKYQDKADQAREDNNERKALKYEARADYYNWKADKYQDKADKAREGNEQKALKYEAIADKYTAKAEKYQDKADQAREGDPEKAAEYSLKATQAREEFDIIQDLNDVLECAINFTPDMLEDRNNNDDDDDDDDDDN
jgi:hypothetical protein